MNKREINISEYYEWIEKIKSKVHSTRSRIALSANSELLLLYWEIGKEIVEKQKKSGWGSKIIEKLAVDLKHEFPDIKGFSKRNIYAMRQWYLLYSQKSEILPQVVAQIPWGQNRLIISKTKNINEAEYALRDINKPLGISEYRLTEVIPENLKTKLPSVEEIENELIGKIEKRNEY